MYTFTSATIWGMENVSKSLCILYCAYNSPTHPPGKIALSHFVCFVARYIYVCTYKKKKNNVNTMTFQVASRKIPLCWFFSFLFSLLIVYLMYANDQYLLQGIFTKEKKNGKEKEWERYVSELKIYYIWNLKFVHIMQSRLKKVK